MAHTHCPGQGQGQGPGQGLGSDKLCIVHTQGQGQVHGAIVFYRSIF